MSADFRSFVCESCVSLLGEPPDAWESLPADGSERTFFRVRAGSGSLVILSYPDGLTTGQNDAYASIGRHLRKMGLPVPMIHKYHREKGWFIMEDLGDLSLQRASLSADTPKAILDLYGPILDLLVSFQERAVHGFQDTWCYQGATYDERLMLEMESGYFLRAFLGGYLGWSGDESALLHEFEGLARAAAEAPVGFIIHRDFQSRNVLLPQEGNPYLIDFQGARRGPPQYDVAALVIDPYVKIGSGVREAILDGYLDRIDASGLLEPGAFMRHYPVIALHRNLQILGAFAFLGMEKKKPFFLQWIRPAIAQLKDLLGNHTQLKCPQLREHVEKAYDRIRENAVS